MSGGKQVLVSEVRWVTHLFRYSRNKK